MHKEIKVSDYIIDLLVQNEVGHIFYVIGGAITHMVDSTLKYNSIECVTVHHEQAAGFVAEGYARLTQKLGVAIATSGPGATNMITAIGSCFLTQCQLYL